MRLIILLLISFLQVTSSQTYHVLVNRGGKDAKDYNTNQLPKNPFLSTTLSTTITYNSEFSYLSSASPFHLDFDSTRKSTFSITLTKFLTKLFNDQQVYELKVLSVNIFDDHILHDNSYEGGSKGTQQDGTRQKSLAFSMVVSAEYTSESQMDTITNQAFSNMLVHVCHKYQMHLMQYMKETGDPYFMDVESIAVGEFQKVNLETEQHSQYLAVGMSREQLHMASIIAIAVGGILFIVLSFAVFKLYR